MFKVQEKKKEINKVQERAFFLPVLLGVKCRLLRCFMTQRQFKD